MMGDPLEVPPCKLSGRRTYEFLRNSCLKLANASKFAPSGLSELSKSFTAISGLSTRVSNGKFETLISAPFRILKNVKLNQATQFKEQGDWQKWFFFCKPILQKCSFDVSRKRNS